MKICITSSAKLNSCETFIQDQITGLGQQAEVLVLHNGRLPQQDQTGQYLAPWHYGIHLFIKAITGKRNNYFGSYGVKKFLLKNKVDLVIANYGLTGAHMAPICKALGIPLVVIFHGHDVSDRKLVNEYAPLYRDLCGGLNSLVAVSYDLKNKLVGLGLSQSKIHVIPCGVNTSKFQPARKKNNRVFLAVGRFTNKKGPLKTIQAFYSVYQKYPDATLVMAGPKKGLYSDCCAYVKSLGLSDAVKFPGNRSHDQVVELMQGAFAFVQHSVTAPNGDSEGTPVSVLEAAASALPVVSTRHGGIVDAVLDSKTGYLVKEGDVGAMADAMIRLIENVEEAFQFGQAGRDHMLKNYEQIRQLSKLLELVPK